MKSFWIIDTTGGTTLAIGENIEAARDWFSRTQTDKVRAFDLPATQCAHCSNYITITVTKIGGSYKTSNPSVCSCIRAFSQQLPTHFAD